MSEKQYSPWKQTILAAMTNYIDAGSIVAGAAGLSLWEKYLGMSQLHLGLLGAFSSNAISAAIGALIGGKICDKYGRKFVYMYDLLVYIVGMLLIVFAVNFPMLLIGYIIVGLSGFFTKEKGLFADILLIFCSYCSPMYLFSGNVLMNVQFFILIGLYIKMRKRRKSNNAIQETIKSHNSSMAT